MVQAKRKNVVNALANRMAKKVKNGKAVKKITNRKKVVKVSKSLREKVKKVLEATAIKGTFITTRQGDLGLWTNRDVSTSYTIRNINAYQNAVVGTSLGNKLTTPYGTANSNSRVWMTGLTIGGIYTSGDEMMYFTPMKIIDAASILWNNKAIERTYENQAGNFNANTVGTSTGVQSKGNGTNPAIQGMKIHVVHSYVKMEFKNNSQRTMYMNLYECVPKQSNPDKLPLDCLISGIQLFADNGVGKRMIKYYVDPMLATNSTNTDVLIQDPNVEPNMIPTFAESYTYTKVEIVVNPGETFIHNIAGPKNFDLDYNKLWVDGQDHTGKLYKKCSVAIMISLKPDLVYGTAGVLTYLGNTTEGSGRWINTTSSTTRPVDPISCEITEVYKLSMPEQSGFYQQAVTAGAAKQLDMRKPALAFANHANNYVTGNNYQHIDEEVPSSIVTSSQFD